MSRSLKILPSIILVIFVLLIVQADPPRSVHAQQGFLALITCEKYDAESYYVPLPPGGTHILAPLVADCPVDAFTVEVEPGSQEVLYRLKLRWLDPATGMPLEETFPMHAEEDLLPQNDPGPLHASRETAVCTNDVLLQNTSPWVLGLTAEIAPGRNAGVDLTAGQTPPSLDLVSGQYLAGVLAFTTTGTVTTTMPVVDPLLLARQLVVTGATPSSSSTEELIWEFNTPASSTAFLASTVELAIAGKSVNGDSLEVQIVDPLGLLEPIIGPGTPTTTLTPFKVRAKATTSLPSFLPGMATESENVLQAGTRYWLIIKVKGEWTLGTDVSQDGEGDPGRLWRRDFDGSIEELQADLAFELVGSATTTSPTGVDPTVGLQSSLSMRISPMPFRQRTRISFEGAGTEARVEIYDLRGRAVRSLRLPMDRGRGVFTWDGRDDSGSSVGAGSYMVRVSTDAGRVASRKVIRLD